MKAKFASSFLCKNISIFAHVKKPEGKETFDLNQLLGVNAWRHLYLSLSHWSNDRNFLHIWIELSDQGSVKYLYYTDTN
jgi:hypothetical protein